jgi:hypothetical protein
MKKIPSLDFSRLMLIAAANAGYYRRKSKLCRI